MRKKFIKSGQSRLVSATSRILPEYIDLAKHYDGGISEYLREAVYNYKDNRHSYKFREILEILAGEILILTKWKEKGHPSGAEWTQELDEQLGYYERCFAILENSPYNGEQY